LGQLPTIRINRSGRLANNPVEGLGTPAGAGGPKTTERGGHDPVRVQIREGAAQVGLADGYTEGRLSQNRGGSWKGGMAPDPAFRPGALWHRLGKFCRTALRAPPGRVDSVVGLNTGPLWLPASCRRCAKVTARTLSNRNRRC